MKSEELTNLLIHFFGLGNPHWNGDNSAEVRMIVQLIQEIVKETVREVLLKGINTGQT